MLLCPTNILIEKGSFKQNTSMERVHSGCYGGGMRYVDKMGESE